jgi:hypothetical protein
LAAFRAARREERPTGCAQQHEETLRKPWLLAVGLYRKKRRIYLRDQQVSTRDNCIIIIAIT